MGTSPCYKKKNDEAKVAHKAQISEKSEKSNQDDVVNQYENQQLNDYDDENDSVVYEYIQGELIQEGCNVYSALNILNGQLLALKIVLIEWINDDINEVLTILENLKTLEQDNIHKIIGWDHTYINNQIVQDEIKILMPYESSGSISWLLQKFSSFSPQLAIEFMKQILKGLEYLHNNEILHRNLKTSNVLVDGDAKAKLSDIYILNKYKLSMYSAPECFKQQQYTYQSDLWSAGCIFVEMLTKQHPWLFYSQDITLDQITKLINQDQIFPINKIPQNKEIKEILLQIFQLNPQKRPSPTSLLQQPLFQKVLEDNSTILEQQYQSIRQTLQINGVSQRYQEQETEQFYLKSINNQKSQRKRQDKQFRLQNSNISQSSIRMSTFQNNSQFQHLLTNLKSIHQAAINHTDIPNNLISHNDIKNLVNNHTKKVEAIIKETTLNNNDNELVKNGIIRPKEGDQNQNHNHNYLPKPNINIPKSMLSASLNQIQTIRSSEYYRSHQQSTDRNQIPKSELEKLEEMMAQQFYVNQQQIDNNQQQFQDVNLNDIEQMLKDQFQQSSFYKSSNDVSINQLQQQQQQQQQQLLLQQQQQQQKQDEEKQPQHVKSEIFVIQQGNQDPNYFDNLMKQQFEDDDDEENQDDQNQNEENQLKQLEDMITQQFYQQNNQFNTEEKKQLNDEKSQKNDEKEKIKNVSIIDFNTLIQSPKLEEKDFSIEGDLILWS